MRLQVLLTPRDVSPDALNDRAVVVFDVLRATTTITAAMAAGVKEIRIFNSAEAALTAAQPHRDEIILVGERGCLPPPGFDLGNSPGAFKKHLHADLTIYMATTNGTRAITAAQSATAMFAGALVNAAAVAEQLIKTNLDVTLLCAGTDGEPAMEDLFGAGAVIDAMLKTRPITLYGDVSNIAVRLFQSCRNDLPSALSQTVGAQNIKAVGLDADIDFAARLNYIPLVPRILNEPLRCTLDKI